MNTLVEEIIHAVNTTESHCETEHEPNLFAAYAVYDFTTGEFFVMVLVVIGFVLLVEFLFHILHFLTHESPFDKMIIAVEKELMTVGFTAFIFKIILNSTKFLRKAWLHAFELADLMVPVFSFCNCFLGLILVFLSIRQCNKWSKACTSDLSDLLSHFYDEKRLWIDKLFPMFNTEIGKMEFRIFHNIFCEMYSLKRDAFAFDEYVNNVFEKFIYSIVKIRPINWILLCLLLYLDYARTSNKLYIHECEKEDLHCIENSSIISFAIVGSIVFGITLIFSLVSHYYESRIIIEKGINSYEYYPIYLQFMEDEQYTQGNRLDGEELKEAAIDLRRAYLAHEHQKHHSLIMKKDHSSKLALTEQLERRHSNHGDFVQNVDSEEVLKMLKSKSSFHTNDERSQKLQSMESESFKINLVDLADDKESITSESSQNNAVDYSNGTSQTPVQDVPGKARMISNRSDGRKGQVEFEVLEIGVLNYSKPRTSMPSGGSKKQQRFAPGLTQSDAAVRKQTMMRATSVEMERHEQILKQFRSTSTLTVENNALLGMLKERQGKKHEHIQELFLFGSPHLYFECVKVLIMFISLNIAYWLIYFIGSVSSPTWKFLSVAPPIVTFILYLDVVKTASLLKAVVSLDTVAMVEVIELSEEAQRLEEEVRKEIVETLFMKEDLAAMSLEEKLETVYRKIDTDGNGHMTRAEFTQFLLTLDIYPSRKALRQIFRKMDRNADNDINLSEFTLFIMPENLKAREEEFVRLEALRERVESMTLRLTEEMQQRDQNPTMWDVILGRKHHHRLLDESRAASTHNEANEPEKAYSSVRTSPDHDDGMV